MRRTIPIALLLLALSACTESSVAPSGSDAQTTTGASPPVPLLGGGKAFGMCLGYCAAELVVRSDGQVTLEMTGWHQPPPDIRNEGTLTPEALARVHEIATRLASASLKEIYGCPDCADGGGAWVQIWTEAGPKRSTYEFGRPPAELERADGSLMALITALESCAATETLIIDSECTPRP